MTVGEMVGEVSKVGTALMQAVSAVSATAARIANAVRLAQAQLEAASAMLVKAARWWVTELPALTQAYCLPYDREIKRLGLPPLTPQERADCLLAAILMAEPEEIGPRHRMPLVEVALLAGRADVVARMAVERGLQREAARGVRARSPEDRQDLPNEAYVALHGEIIPSIERRILNLEPAKARPVLEAVTGDGYLVASMRRALLEGVQRDVQCAEEPLSEEEADKAAAADTAPPLALWDTEAAVARFLRRRGASDLDRRIAAALWKAPDASAAQIAHALRASERTVRDHLGKLRRYLQAESQG